MRRGWGLWIGAVLQNRLGIGMEKCSIFIRILERYYSLFMTLIFLLHSLVVHGHLLCYFNCNSITIRGQKIIDMIKVDSTRTLGDIVSYRELITCQKFTHFEHIKNDSGYSYEQMIFIDDEKHNLDDVVPLSLIDSRSNNLVLCASMNQRVFLKRCLKR